MVELGYALSSEEHPPDDLLRWARRAEETGFTFACISDHFHPWIGKQGNSPFVWTVLGAIAKATERLQVGTGVTCPTIRMHPAVVAHAAATTAAMMPGRFFLGVGSGENLNEHVTGAPWPATDLRLEMLEESVEIIKRLWSGEVVTHRGKHFTVESARLFTIPDEPPPIYMASGGSRSAGVAGRVADGLIATSPEAKTLRSFDDAGGKGKPRYGQVTVCWAQDEKSARRTAHEWWPNAAIRGELGQELPSPKHFEQAAQLVTEDDVADAIVCGPDPEQHLAKIRSFIDAGFDYVYIHQVGPDQQGFFTFYEQEILPKLR